MDGYVLEMVHLVVMVLDLGGKKKSQSLVS
jgi:hypothetical protein